MQSFCPEVDSGWFYHRKVFFNNYLEACVRLCVVFLHILNDVLL
jgi:hypothetical protein